LKGEVCTRRAETGATVMVFEVQVMVFEVQVNPSKGLKDFGDVSRRLVGVRWKPLLC
jgi:hypothetical protein